MPNWKKLIVSGSEASLSGLQLTNLSAIDDNTVLVIDASGTIGTKEHAASSGTSGANGGNGTSGTSGANGGNGTSGTSGANGGNGTSGINGTSGTSGANGGDGTSGTSGNSGTSGAQGPPGSFGGVALDYTYGGAGSLIPGSVGNGTIKLYASMAIQASASRMDISVNDDNGENVLSYFNAIAAVDSAVKGHVKLYNKTDQTQFLLFAITSTTLDSYTYRFGLSGLASSTNSPFSTNEDVIAAFVLTGDKGDNGTSGTSGANGGNGTSGTSGANGGNGTSGTSGANGGNGTSGTSGANGGNGTSGTSGANGGNGTSGTSGLLALSGTTNNGAITYNSGGGTVEPNVQFTTGNSLFQTSQFNVNSQNAYFNIDQTHFGNSNNYGQLILADDYYGGELGILTTDDVLIAAQLGTNIIGLAGEYPGAQVIEIDYSKYTGKIGFNHTINSSANHSYIAGGCTNSIVGSHSFIGGGRNNTVKDTCDFIGGGCANTTSQTGLGFNSIVGGRANGIQLSNNSCLGNFIGGGQSNCFYGQIGWATIPGGYNNCVENDSSFTTIGGGCDNHIKQANSSTIGGGRLNKLGGTNSSDNATIAGGNSNLIGNVYGNAQSSVIGGGRYNEVKGSSSWSQVHDSTVGGGCCNRIRERVSVIAGGKLNTIFTCQAFIGGGSSNTINSQAYSGGILGGTSNTANAGCSFIIGNGITANSSNYTYMNNACVLGTTRTTFLVETSAKKHKECILPLESQIENIKKLEPVSFTWKDDKKEDIGLIAEQVETILPKMVSYEEDGELHGVKYSKLTAVLIKAFQEQQKEIESLKLEIDKLKNK